MNTISYLILSLLMLIVTACGPNGDKNESAIKAGMHWNISVLIDLSNRIDTAKHSLQPPQMERDLAIIQILVALFKAHIQAPGKGTFNTRDKFKVFFHPLPDIASIQDMARCLTIDLGPMDPKSKKRIFQDMDERILSTLRQIYEKTLTQSRYEGSDIWGFMKEDVISKCIEPDSAYRNVLVILTDGYLYWKYDMRQKENRYNFIERGQPHLTRFRNTGTLEKEFDAKDYGFMTSPNDLSRLEVMVMELDYPKASPQDYDILKRYWSKWLTEMQVKKMMLSKTDLPVHTERLIKEFMGE